MSGNGLQRHSDAKPARSVGEDEFYRPAMRKSIWCEGCGLGNLQQMLTRVLAKHVGEKLGVDPTTPGGLEQIKNNIVMVSGIGCTSRMPGHLDVNSLHTTHGRSLAFATGIKMARPELTVALVAGDGDIFAIGGNHFIHAARRNPDITLIVYDNQSYGMTGSQHSPTSPQGEISASAPYGVFEPPFDLVALAIGAGASFVAQGAVTTLQEHQEQLEQLIEEAIVFRGFSFVNVRGTCHTGWGSRNGLSEAFRYRKHIEKRTLPVERWSELPLTKRTDLIPLGVVHRSARPDLQSSSWYTGAVERVRQIKIDEPLEALEVPRADPLADSPRTSIRFAGSGGQGLITAGELALKSVLLCGKNGVYTKNYGPEARGGEAYSELIVSDSQIHFPQAGQLDVLVALNQETFDKFRDLVAPNGKIFVNSTSVTETYRDPRVIASPMGELLVREVRPPRRELGLNVMALALTLAYLDLVPKSALEDTVMKGIGKANPSLNRKVLEIGFREAERLRS